MTTVLSRVARSFFSEAVAERAQLSSDDSQTRHGPIAKVWRRSESLVVPLGRPSGWIGSNRESWSRVKGRWPNHVWRYEILAVRPPHTEPFETLIVVDEFTEECLTLRVGPRLLVAQVVEALDVLVAHRGAPARLRHASGPEKIAVAVRQWLRRSGKVTRHCEAPLAGVEGRRDSLRQRLTGVIQEKATIVTHEAAQALAETWRAALNAKTYQSTVEPRAPVTRQSGHDVA